MTPLVESRGATRRFGRLVAVDGVDLAVGPGEVVGLLGANGAGKTTLLRMLLGLLAVSEGEVLLFGRPPSRATRRRVGYVPQGLGLYEDLTPAENLAFARRVFGAAPREIAPSLRDVAHIPVGASPLGTRRRVAFELALAHRPELLVLDEPTSGVDPLQRARLWETIRDAAEGGSGVLVTTHHMEEAEECDRLLVMAEGRVVAAGTVGEIVGDARVVVVEADDWPRAFATLEAAGMRPALVGRRLRVIGAAPEAVRRALGDLPCALSVERATLEERFAELTLAGARRPGAA